MIGNETDEKRLLSRLAFKVLNPTNMRRWPRGDLMLGQRRRRWPNIQPLPGQRFFFSGYIFLRIYHLNKNLISPNVVSMLGHCMRRRPSIKAALGQRPVFHLISGLVFVKGLAQAKIIKKSVILFWLLNMTI